jgi:hypothetical protein
MKHVNMGSMPHHIEAVQTARYNLWAGETLMNSSSHNFQENFRCFSGFFVRAMLG